MKLKPLTLILPALLMLTACVQESVELESAKELMILGKEKNPNLCPEIIDPICGKKDNKHISYLNECLMDSDKAAYVSRGPCLGETEIVCPADYAPVCGQPPMPHCPEGFACIQALPQPQTYDNKCFMMAAGAQFLHDRECSLLSETGK
jgi:hypothetical protein